MLRRGKLKKINTWTVGSHSKSTKSGRSKLLSIIRHEILMMMIKIAFVPCLGIGIQDALNDTYIIIIDNYYAQCAI